jgi:superfamily I DNA/RNA helicase
MTTPTLPSTPAAAPKTRVYSPYQQAVFTNLTEGQGNVVINAVAGSGKTTTIVEALNRWQAAGNSHKRALFCCFNKGIAAELERRVPAGVEAKTLHSLSFGALKRRFPKLNKVDEHKLDDYAVVIAEEALKATSPAGRVDPKSLRTLTLDLCRGYGLLKGTLCQLDDAAKVEERLAEYSVELETSIAPQLFGKLDERMRADTSRITFDEMLSFVIDHDARMPQFDLICVDESQDLNALQIAILRRCLRADGRLVAVGDPWQAIYLFRGADNNAMGRIAEEFKVPAENQLPLSITYRCPKAVVTFAQEFVPHIEASETAIEGVVEHRSDKKEVFHKTIASLQPGHMVLCRANAPLVTCALQLIAMGRRAMIKGRDIGKSITKLVNDLMKKASSQQVESLARVVVDHQTKQVEKLRAARKDRQADQLADKCETLLAIIEGATSFREVENRIETLFSDRTEAGSVVFSSIHRAKGLEAETVVWLGPEISDFISEKCTTESARAQEKNLSYVAITRAQKTLIVQPMPSREKEE